MVLRNLWFVPYGWFKLCYTAAHVEKYTEEERYQVLKMIDRRANIGGRITIDAYGVENIPEQDAGLHFLVHVDTQWTDVQLTAWLRSRGIRVQALSSFYHDNPPGDLHQLVVNYSGIDVERLEQALKTLDIPFTPAP